MGKLSRVKTALERQNQPPEKTLDDVIAAFDRLDVNPVVNTQQVDTRPIMEALASVKELLAELKRVEPQNDVDLSPVLNALNGISLDLSPVIQAIESQHRPTEWKLIHKRDRLGRIIETEAYGSY